MAGFLGEEQIRRIKEAIDLVDVIADYTTLKQSGVNFNACCPFHHERSPSFYIYTADQHYHCFGCGVHGDVVTLIQEKEGLDFSGAMEWLARRAGIELTYEKGSKETGLQKSEKQRYLDAMDFAAKFYERQLWSTSFAAEARAYLESRFLDEELCRTFRLGWAPGRDALTQAAKKEGFSFEDLKLLDVSVSGERGVADRFRQRLLFPICDRFGQVVAFSGRLLPATEKDYKEKGIGVGKYINSRDTPLYHKGNVVFNLHVARPAARESKRLIVMEGPTDVMTAHKHGIKECVAVLGTALTSQHAKQISQSVGQDGRVILLFDGDSAGQKNSVKAVKTCMQAGVSSQSAVVPDGHDPAELLGKVGSTGLEKVLQQRLNDIDHLLRTIAPRPHELDSRQQLAVIDEILSVLREVADRDLREAFSDDTANYLNIDALKLRRRMEDGIKTPQPRFEEDYDDETAYVLPSLNKEQEHVVGILCTQPQLRSDAFDGFECEPNDFPQPWRQVVLALSLNNNLDQEGLLLLPEVVRIADLRKALLAICHRFSGLEVQAAELAEVMTSMLKRRCEQRMKELEFDLLEAGRKGLYDKTRELHDELKLLINERRRLMGHEIPTDSP